MARQLHLNLFVHSRGHHEASWRHPDASELSLTDVGYYQDLAQRAEAGLFDSVFFADQLALGADIAHGPRTGLEPITLLSALAVSTNRIGLIATASTIVKSASTVTILPLRRIVSGAGSREAARTPQNEAA